MAQFFGIQLDISQYVLIALVSVLGSAATAGTTGAVVMLTSDEALYNAPRNGDPFADDATSLKKSPGL